MTEHRTLVGTIRSAAFVLMVSSIGALSACQKDVADTNVSAVFIDIDGRVFDKDGGIVGTNELLKEARGRPVSISFAYVGCGGPAGRMQALESAAQHVEGGSNIFHVVLNAIDEPSRYPEIVKDITRGDPSQLDPDKLRILFVQREPLWPKKPNSTVESLVNAMGLRYGTDKLIETISGIGLFDQSGRFIGIRY